MFEFTFACASKRNYVSPPDAGPVWRAAYEAGYNMVQLESNLRLIPEERLSKHDKLLNEWLQFESFVEKFYRGWNFIKSSCLF